TCLDRLSDDGGDRARVAHSRWRNRKATPRCCPRGERSEAVNDLDFTVVYDALPYLWGGLQFSLALTASSFAIGMVLGTLLALMRHLGVPVLSQIVQAYIALMRSLPLILVLFWFFFLVPIVLGHLTPSGRPIPVGATWTAFITFGLFEAAYYAEI